MDIEIPDFIPARQGLVHRNITSILDVWRHYDLEKADKVEAADNVATEPATA